MAYGDVSGYDMHWCNNSMEYTWKKMKEYKVMSTRMEGSLDHTWVKLLGMISNGEAEIKLRDRLFYRMLKTLRDSIWYLYDNPTVSLHAIISCI